MDVVKIFGKAVGDLAPEHPEIARNLLLTGYRLQDTKLRYFPNKKLPSSGQYVAEIVMRNMIQALSKPENAAMVSIFCPGELITAAGLKPYSVEALSCFMTGTKCEQAFLAQTQQEGFPETMCSYHRIFLGTALNGFMPKPKCMLYTNLACDGNMMTFPFLKEHYQVPAFFIDVPYEKNPESVHYVADQLRDAKKFLEDTTSREITDESLKKALANSNQAAKYYQRQLSLRKDRNPATTLTNELYAIFMCQLLAGSPEALKYTKLLYRDVQKAPKDDGIGIVWMHIMPFMQAPVQQVFNFSDKVHFRACDFVYAGFRVLKEEDPYEAMAHKMVYSIYNGSVQERIQEAIRVAKLTHSDGIILFAHWGCKSTIGASPLIKKELEAAGFPTLVLDGDGVNPANTSDGQVSTRLNAFIEMLEEKRREKS